MKNKPDTTIRDYDAIVVGTGISGGWAAKELCERGLRTLVIDRGRNVRHGDYPTADKDVWELPDFDELTPKDLESNPGLSRIGNIKPSNLHWYMKDEEQPYQEKSPFLWVRGDQVGGRSIMWGRQVYRWSPMDFEANAKEGIGIDWPIRYEDIAPWYDYVEKFIGVSGRKEGLPQVPDGIFLPPMEMNCIESHISEEIRSHYLDRIMTIGRVANLTIPHNGRGPCQYRDRCDRGCPYGAYFCSLSSTLPAAGKTGKMTLMADTIVTEVLYDEETARASGVRVLDKESGRSREFKSRIVFLNASSFGSTWILLNSKSARFPNGMGNDSDQLGRNVMDHYIGGGAKGISSKFKDKYYEGRRPNGIYIPRFQNIGSDVKKRDYLRGFQYQGRGSRESWWRTIPEAIYGLELKEKLLQPGNWQFAMMGLGEMLPDPENRIYLHESNQDKYGLPTLVMDVKWGDNEKKMAADMKSEAFEMLTKVGLEEVEEIESNAIPASSVHEMGTARMGLDPETSVLNRWNQIHAVPNVFVTDGSCMTSSACQNPSLTYMALTVRAADYAVKLLKKGEL